MNVTRSFFLSALLLVLLFTACRDGRDPLPVPPDAVDYSRGVLVVNEGPFGGTGTITWHNPATGETVQDLFGQANNGAALGQFVQSLTVVGDKTYIVVNGANKIYAVDARTFEYLDTIGPLASPRYFQPLSADFAYVSQWGLDGLSGSIAKVELNTNAVVKTIPVGHGPEKMLLLGLDRIVVANSGGYGVDSTVSILDWTTDTEIERRVQPGLNPACLASASFVSGQFFALGKGYWQAPASTGWLAAGPSYLHATLPQGADDLTTNNTGTELFFTAGGGIYRATDAGVTKLFDQAAYGLYYRPATGELYCGDAKDFNSNGEVIIRKPTGEQTGSFPVGVAPGEILIRE